MVKNTVSKSVVEKIVGKKSKLKVSNKLENRIMFVLDDSGSMSVCAQEARKAFNEAFETVKQEATLHKQTTTVSLCKFGERVDFPYLGVPCEQIPYLTASTYNPRQSYTAVWDAIGESIQKLERSRGSKDQNVSFLLIVITDGNDNFSKHFLTHCPLHVEERHLCSLIKKVLDTGRWSIVLQVPPGRRKYVAETLGIPYENVIEWEGTKESIELTSVATQKGLSSYFRSRAGGATNVKNFYVTTDLTKVNKRTLNSKLDDVSSHYKCHEVKIESEIEPFVTSKTKRPYIRGEAFYQLMKKETVQPDKEILILDKRDGKLYGGSQARSLIGLPNGQSAKVTPGLHGDKEIYVASKSTNRKLPRGTKVLIRG